MSLVLEIEFLAGVCRAAAHSPASATPEWPPQPDRVFSGLVSAWAVRGEQSSKHRALEWLEAQGPPAIYAGGHTARTAPDVFVPPNDQRASTAAATYLKIMPRSRPRQPRRFPVAYLDDPVMAMAWEAAEPAPERLAALDALARDMNCLGHSASLVRCRFLTRRTPAMLAHASVPALRQVYPGKGPPAGRRTGREVCPLPRRERRATRGERAGRGAASSRSSRQGHSGEAGRHLETAQACTKAQADHATADPQQPPRPASQPKKPRGVPAPSSPNRYATPAVVRKRYHSRWTATPSGRALARAPVGGGFPAPPFR